MIKILLSKKLGELRLTQADLARATGIRPKESWHNRLRRKQGNALLDKGRV